VTSKANREHRDLTRLCKSQLVVAFAPSNLKIKPICEVVSHVRKHRIFVNLFGNDVKSPLATITPVLGSVAANLGSH